jgi:DNA topoisomerase-2
MSEKKPKRTIEQQYQKKSQLEHILLRPDTYVGSIEHQSEQLWVWDKKKNEMVYRTVKIVPGLFKIFDEILVNAADNFQRDPESMTFLKVTIDEHIPSIEVENDGQAFL